MGMSGRHYNGFPLMKQVIYAVNGNLANTIQAGNECIPTGFMSTDLLALGKRKQGARETD